MKPTGYAVMRDEGRGIGAIFPDLDKTQNEQIEHWKGYVTRIVAIVPVTLFTDNANQDLAVNSRLIQQWINTIQDQYSEVCADADDDADDDETTLIGKAISDPGQFVPRKTGWVDRSSGKRYGERETVQQWQTRAVSKALSSSGQRARKDQQPAAGLAGYFSAMPTDIRPKAVTSILVLDNTEAWLTAADGEQVYGIVPTGNSQPVTQPAARPVSEAPAPAAANTEPQTDQVPSEEQHIRKIIDLVQEYGRLQYTAAVEGEKGGPDDEQRAETAAGFMLSKIRSALALTCNVVDHARAYRKASQEHSQGSATCCTSTKAAECYVIEVHDALFTAVEHLEIVARYDWQRAGKQRDDSQV